MDRKHDPDGRRLPIKLDSTSNGEFAPLPLGPLHRKANDLAGAAASEIARRLGMPRRNFLVSAMGAASTLLAFNEAFAGAGRRGSHYDLDRTAAFDPDAARGQLGGREFIFDVQGHFVGREWVGRHPLGGADTFVKDVFLDSDTDMMVLSFIPSTRVNEKLPIQEAAAVQEIVEKLEGDQRLLIHGRVNPNQPGDLDDMDELANRYKVSAFKTYTQWGPDGKGFFLTDDIGLAMIERARKLGVRNICVHKGLPFGQRSYEHSLCTDIGPVARMYPDMNFLVYHSGFVSGRAEGPYDASAREGIDVLIRSVLESGYKPGGNVYAELGSTWRQLMRDPDSAAHAIGKLVKHFGPDNLLWGTDSIWYGSPQDQIQAFRSFQISREFQERFGYEAMTPALRARIFGLSAARVYGIDVAEVKRRAATDGIGRARAAYREAPDPHFLTPGPRTRAEFLRLMRMNGGKPS